MNERSESRNSEETIAFGSCGCGAYGQLFRTGKCAHCYIAELEAKPSEIGARNAVIEEVAKSVEDAPLTYFGPDPGGIRDLKYLIVASIRDMKGKP